MDLEIGIEQWAEESQTLQVVEVEVTQQDVQFRVGGRLQDDAERADSCTRVEHEH